MTDETTKQMMLVPASDGYAGFNDEVEGTNTDGTSKGGRVIQGNLVKFTNSATWELRDGEKISPDREFLHVDIVRVCQKWLDQMPVVTHIIEHGKKFLDVKALNAAAPQEEWTEVDGKKVGPWQMQYIHYLIDPVSIDRFSFPTGTIGGGICSRDIADRVQMMRMLRGECVHPIVRLSDTFMPTKHGGRQRPHFAVQRWVIMGGVAKSALPAPEPPKPAPLIERDPEPTTGVRPLPGLQTVNEPTMAEVMNDELPPWDSENPAPPDPSPTASALTAITPSAPIKKPAAASRPAKRVQKVAGQH
jgi:hypothetical protein